MYGVSQGLVSDYRESSRRGDTETIDWKKALGDFWVFIDISSIEATLVVNTKNNR